MITHGHSFATRVRRDDGYQQKFFVFAQIKPTTRTRIDLGLALKGTKVSKRLIDTGGLAKKDRITHRIEITSLKDIDAEVKKWLRIAHEMDR